MGNPCDFDCFGNGNCLYAAEAFSCDSVMANNSLALEPGASGVECGCLCDAGFRSTSKFFSEISEMPINCHIHETTSLVMAVSIIILGLVCALYAFRIIVWMILKDGMVLDTGRNGHWSQFSLHLRSFFFSLHVVIVAIIRVSEGSNPISYDQSTTLIISRVIIAAQVMGSTIVVTFLWTKLLPMKIMKNEPIMKLVSKFEYSRFKIEYMIYAGFIISIVVAAIDLQVGFAICFTEVAFCCPIPMYFLSAVSSSLYKKMHPDKEMGQIGALSAMYHIYMTGAKSKKKTEGTMLKKFEGVVFKLRLSVGAVLMIGGGAISLGEALQAAKRAPKDLRSL